MAYFEKYLCSKRPNMAYFENENGLFWWEQPGHPVISPASKANSNHVFSRRKVLKTGLQSGCGLGFDFQADF